MNYFSTTIFLMMSIFLKLVETSNSKQGCTDCENNSIKDSEKHEKAKNANYKRIYCLLQW